MTIEGDIAGIARALDDPEIIAEVRRLTGVVVPVAEVEVVVETREDKEKRFAEMMGADFVTARGKIKLREAGLGRKMTKREKIDELEKAGYLDKFGEALQKEGLDLERDKKEVDEFRRWCLVEEEEPEVVVPAPVQVRAPEPPPALVNVADDQKLVERILMGPLSKEGVRLMRKAVERSGARMDADVFQRAMAEIAKAEQPAARVEIIPTEPLALRRYMRQKMIEVIRNETNSGRLNVDQIEEKITSNIRNEMMVADPYRMSGIELYPRALGDQFVEVQELVRAEIKARANLRQLQLKEEAYKQGNKKNSLLTYVRDMEGSEGGQASPSTIAHETYQWLKNLDNLEDPEGVTIEKIDKALSILLKLGEKNPDFSDPEVAVFAQFRVGLLNIYDPKYNPQEKQRALDMVAEKYGNDARDLAYQLFQAYKEEGNYNSDHYLYIVYQFSEARKKAKAIGVPIGSTRVYEEGQGGHEDQIPYLALSPLRAQAKIGEGIDPATGEPKDIKRIRYLYQKALEGKFLQSLDITNLKNMPEREAFGELKEALVLKTAIEKIGTLGAEGKGKDSLGEIRTQLNNIRNSGQELVDRQVFTQEMLDDQILIEAVNAFWELSIQYSTNISLTGQSLEKPHFLLPSDLVIMFEMLGDETGKKNFRIIGDARRYGRLKKKVEELMKVTYNRIKDQGVKRAGQMLYHQGDEDRLKEQEKVIKTVTLPSTPGEKANYLQGFRALFT